MSSEGDEAMKLESEQAPTPYSEETSIISSLLYDALLPCISYLLVYCIVTY
jgi:hypothetical protein